ncbi:deoxyguanosinetriphosphate triphosphohydrolase family protein [Stenotrophomonas sp. CFBP 13718]|nr:deoxyguanosinetriphosphate triphosphohydrolase family protein [Stenotrophomonas sp. CFBP 13718]
MWAERQGESGRVDSWRDPYGRDRARVIHSGYFRRLQGKTQVLGLGESDFYRTRLTHSIEVAQIASGIVEALRAIKDDPSCEFLPSPQLIEAIALAHDIGHPPFGHGGEVALNYCMRDHDGFEGNAQTLRIATRLGEYSEECGLNLTRRTLLGLIKYPVLHSRVVNKIQYGDLNSSLNLDNFKPPKCIYDSDAHALDFVLSPLPGAEKSKFCQADGSPKKHAKSCFKSLDTSIMELADDIAYGVHDLEDAIALRFVNEKQWRLEVYGPIKDVAASLPLSAEIDWITDELFSGSSLKRKHAVSYLVGWFIRKCGLAPRNVFSDQIFDLTAEMNPQAKSELELLKSFVVKNVIKSAEVQSLEYKGQQMVIRLFEALDANPMRLLPDKQRIDFEISGQRAICDYLAGMTDDYATRLYHKIFTPSSGSVFDKL